MLEHMRVVDGVDAVRRRRDPLAQVVDDDVSRHRIESSPSLAFEDDPSREATDSVLPQPLIRGPIDVYDERARLRPATEVQNSCHEEPPDVTRRRSGTTGRRPRGEDDRLGGGARIARSGTVVTIDAPRRDRVVVD
jgi:hypothetical protein